MLSNRSFCFLFSNRSLCANRKESQKEKSKKKVAIVISESNSFFWLVSTIYASINYGDRIVFSQEMTALIDQGFPVVVSGDFNCIVGLRRREEGGLLWMTQGQ